VHRSGNAYRTKRWMEAAAAMRAEETWKTPRAPLLPVGFRLTSEVLAGVPLVATELGVMLAPAAAVVVCETLIVWGMLVTAMALLLTPLMLVEVMLNGADWARMPGDCVVESGMDIKLTVQLFPIGKPPDSVTLRVPAEVETGEVVRGS